MNYKDFYQELQPYEKNVKDGLAILQKLFKAVSREMAGGDVKNLAAKQGVQTGGMIFQIRTDMKMP